MAELGRQLPPQIQSAGERIKSATPQILTAVTLGPFGGFLLLLALLTLTGTVIGLAAAAPLFVIFSPILVPAALIISLAVAGFLTSGALAITAISSLTWIVNHLRRSGWWTEAKRRVEEEAGRAGQMAKELTHAVQGKAQEAKRT